MLHGGTPGRLYPVALLAEGVGRNPNASGGVLSLPVALLAEGVGRNNFWCLRSKDNPVALLAEGVGRNFGGNEGICCVLRRPPRGGRG